MSVLTRCKHESLSDASMRRSQMQACVALTAPAGQLLKQWMSNVSCRWQSIMNGELPGWDSSDEDEDEYEDEQGPIGTEGGVAGGIGGRRGGSLRGRGLGSASADDDSQPSEG